MTQTPIEVGATFLASILFWLLLVLTLYLLWRKPGRAQHFVEKMTAHRRLALGITLVYLAAGLVGAKLDIGRTLGVLLGSAQYFCQALIGLALAYSIVGFEPLPVTRAIAKRERPWRATGLMVGIGLLAGVVAIVIGAVGQGIIMSIVHETPQAQEAANLVATDKLLSFFSFLSGAGIAEETPYRLVLLTLAWRLAGGAGEHKRGRRLAIWISALGFALYHFTPLDSIYLVFWQYPISHFVATLLIGLLWGFLFTRRGYETVVLAHTMSDWISVLLFA
jgi:membrane protease YdiL (CAAX protease family)